MTRICGEGGGEEGVEGGDARGLGEEVQVCQRVGDVFFVEGEEVGGADGDGAFLVPFSVIVVISSQCGHVVVQSGEQITQAADIGGCRETGGVGCATGLLARLVGDFVGVGCIGWDWVLGGWEGEVDQGIVVGVGRVELGEGSAGAVGVADGGGAGGCDVREMESMGIMHSPVKGRELEADAARWNFGLGKAERGLGIVVLEAV